LEQAEQAPRHRPSPEFTMGLVETLVEDVSVTSVLVLMPGLMLAYMMFAVVVRPAWQEIKLARMPGERAPQVKAKLPFGECFLVHLGVPMDGRHVQKLTRTPAQASTSSGTACERP